MNIQAILFDMGGTLCYAEKRPHERPLRIQQILDLLGASLPIAEFSDLLTSRARAYRAWCEHTLDEASEEELWTEWLLPDWPVEQVRPLAQQLNHHWRRAGRALVPYPEAAPVLRELFRRGYRLGVVSNTTGPDDAPRILGDLGVRDCFETLVLSSTFGKRKPHPSIFLAATHTLGLEPRLCAYVGDNPARDVVGSRQAGLGLVVIRPEPGRSVPAGPEMQPDRLIGDLNDLLEIFPPLPQRRS